MKTVSPHLSPGQQTTHRPVQRIIRRWSAAVLALALFWAVPSWGALVTLTNTDGTSVSSFMNAGNWDSGKAPTNGNAYYVPPTKGIRTPGDANPHIFAGDSLTVAGTNSGTGFLFKGSGLLTITNLIFTSNSPNIYHSGTGATPDAGRLAGNITLSNSPTLTIDFNAANNRYIYISSTINGAGTLQIQNGSQVTLSNQQNFTGTVSLGGSSLELGSSCSLWPSNLYVAQDGAYWTAPYMCNATNWVRAGATLSVGYGAGSAMRVGYRGNSSDKSNPLGVFDASAVSQFSANIGNLYVAYNASSSGTGCAAGLVFLATNNNITAATSFIVGDSVGAASPLTNLVVLGRGSNYVNTPMMKVGARKQSAMLTLPAGALLVLTNSSGNGRVNLSVGANTANATNGIVSSQVDLSGGTTIASIDTLIVGQKSSGGTGGAVGSMTTSANPANVIDVNNMTLGSMANGGSLGSGTFSFNGGTLNVNNAITLGSYDGNGGSADGTFNLNGGTVNAWGSIAGGGGASTLNLNSGLLNMPVAAGINVDTLVVNGTITNAGSITVKSLSGSGSIVNQGGVTTVNGPLSPGTDATPGTLKVGSLTLGSGATLIVSLTNSTTVGGGVNDFLDVTGNLDLGYSQLSITRLATTLVAGGVYRLANVTGQIYGTLQSTTVGRYTIQPQIDNNSSPAHLDLVVTGNPFALLWDGTYGTNWDTSSSSWLNPADSILIAFADGDLVRFDDSSAYPVVNLDTTVQPGGITVSNNSKAYTLASASGQGRISGATGLTKQGTGTLYLNTSNDFTGAVTISGGQLVAGSPAALGASGGMTTVGMGASLDVNGQALDGETVHAQGAGSGSGAIVNNGPDARNALKYLVLDGPTTVGGAGRWDVSGTGAASSASVQGGSATLTKVGTNTFGLSGGCNGTFGDLAVNGGAVALGGNSTINPGYGIAVNSGATFALESVTGPLGRNVTVQNGGTLQAAAGSKTQNIVSGSLGLNGVATVDVGGYMTLAGPVSGSGPLVKVGSGTLVLSATNNNWSGGLLISTGTVAVGSGGLDGSLPNMAITNYGTLLFNSSNSFTLTQPIYGSGALRKIDDGILSLAVSNSFTGSVTTGDGTPTSGGIIRLLNSYGFGDGLTPKSVSVLFAEVRLEGGIDIPAGISFSTGGYNTYPSVAGIYSPFHNIAGTNTVEGAVTLIAGEGDSQYLSDAGCLVFNGPISLGNIAGRSALFDGAGDGVVNGVLSNQTTTNFLSVQKRGSGTWTLTATNTYGGTTTVSNGTLVVNGSIGGSAVTVSGGTLSGTGSISAPVTINAAGTLSPGPSIGTLSFSTNLSLGGNVLAKLNKSLVQSNDFIAVAGVLTNKGTGAVTVTNLGPALKAGDTFVLFSQPVLNGSALTVSSADGVVWTNNLAIDGSIAVLSVPSLVNTNPPCLTNIVAGGNMNLSWPADRLGWRLQIQTNRLGVGLSTNWQDWPGSTTNTAAIIPIVSTNQSVFLRMVYP